MKKTLLLKAMTLLSILLLAASLQAQASDDAATAGNPETPAAPGNSKVRIVRLSLVKGAVQIDRHISGGFEPAITNLPVVENNRIRTDVGIAEVEFEDNTSLRIAPNSMVDFPSLERSASGATESAIRLLKGTAFISVMKAQNKKAPENLYTLVFGTRKLNLDPATHVRVELTGTEAKLAVLDGTVHIASSNGDLAVTKKKTATFQILDQNEPTVAKEIEPTPYDGWDHNAASYHSNVAALSAFNSPYSYGLADLGYYGSFMNGGAGCGNMWRPYFASASWDPFANGTWAWYPGAGYSWVSPYPWAWTPYHSGSWAFCPNVGWGWMPGGGGGWYGVNNVAALSPIMKKGGTGGGTSGPRTPGHPPLPHQPTMIAVNTKPVASSELGSPTSFVFRKDSAGLGIPRGTLGELGKFSREAVEHGTATTHIYTSVPETGRGNGSMTASESMGTSIHRGYAPSAGYSSTSRSSIGSSGFGSSSASSAGSARSTAGPAPMAPSAASSGGGSKK